ncbi:amidohydrolase family protein [Pelagicoccus albus]|uniref:Amidohydrolase family protein n=1 Tax=Pelagicoccus albus TaxID=415222 RepID=A0A7X1B8Y8_9BACT|nr:amidohydrolase family protein [Pelagicoccus albus]MBC2607885.1 amidohydrolase family protein [Pelagicoccus albus]
MPSTVNSYVFLEKGRFSKPDDTSGSRRNSFAYFEPAFVRPLVALIQDGSSWALLLLKGRMELSESSHPKLVVENALILDAATPDFAPYYGHLVVATDGRIQKIGQGPAPSYDSVVSRLDAKGQILAPGFVSAHSHLFTSASRGLGEDQSLYGWIVAMTRYTDHCDDEDIYYLSKHGAVDFLRNGITTAYDFTSTGVPFQMEDDGHGTFSQDNYKPITWEQAQFKAKLDAGIRFINSVWLAEMQSKEATFARLEALVNWSNQFQDHPQFLRMALSGTVQWAEKKETAALELEAMQRFGLINQPHFLETPHNIEGQREKFWWYHEAGALSPDLIFGHFIHAGEEIIQTAARCGCGAVWQPTSNGRLASGVADVPCWLKHGMNVGVGLDDQSCTDLSDPFQNMRIGIYTLRATHKDPAAMSARKMLYLHTKGSAETLQIADQVGSLEVGKYADFLLVDPQDPDTGPIHDPISTYVLACSLRNLKGVYVGGERRVIDGKVEHLDARELSSEVHNRINRIRAKVSPDHPLWTHATTPVVANANA